MNLPAKSEKKTRTRLSPEARKTMILDTAAELIAEEGVSAVTMDRLGKEAGTSKALVYNYFPSVTVLLQTLLVREYRHLRHEQYLAAEGGQTLEDVVRRVTKVYLNYIRERGLLIERLAAEPSVADNGDPTDYSREASVDYMAEVLSDNFGIDQEIARPVVDISYGLPSAAGHYLTHHDVDFDTIENITVIMILGSLSAINREYALSLRPLRRRQRSVSSAD